MLLSDTLIREIIEVNGSSLDLTHWRYTTLLRWIAQIQCDYKLPYKSIIFRLKRIKAIDEEFFNKLIKEPVRTNNSTYHLIGLNVDKNTFEMLNKPTRRYGADVNVMEKIIRNYENGIISLTELADDLALFNKGIIDFGLKEDIDPDDLDEINNMFLEKEKHEA